MIEVKDLVKNFGDLTAVDHVSFTVSKGEVLGFLGPNGAGKSTTMKIITGFQAPTAGTAIVCGHDVIKAPLQVKTKIGYLPESAPSYPDMTVIGFLTFIGKIRGFSQATLKSNLDRVIEICQLNSVLHKKIETLSKGFKQRTCFAQALIHDPEVLVLDEPTDGLDPNQKHMVRKLIRDLRSEKAIILSTHILEEVEAVCDRAIIISKGKIVANEKPNALKSRSKYCGAVKVLLNDVNEETVKSTFLQLPSIKNIELQKVGENKTFTLFPKSTHEPITGVVFETIKNHGWDTNHIYTDQGRLDDVFRELTTSEANA